MRNVARVRLFGCLIALLMISTLSPAPGFAGSPDLQKIEEAIGAEIIVRDGSVTIGKIRKFGEAAQRKWYSGRRMVGFIIYDAKTSRWDTRLKSTASADDIVAFLQRAVAGVYSWHYFEMNNFELSFDPPCPEYDSECATFAVVGPHFRRPNPLARSELITITNDEDYKNVYGDEKEAYFYSYLSELSGITLSPLAADGTRAILTLAADSPLRAAGFKEGDTIKGFGSCEGWGRAVYDDILEKVHFRISRTCQDVVTIPIKGLELRIVDWKNYAPPGATSPGTASPKFSIENPGHAFALGFLGMLAIEALKGESLEDRARAEGKTCRKNLLYTYGKNYTDDCLSGSEEIGVLSCGVYRTVCE